MAVHPLFRVRRLCLAARLVAGDEPRPAEYRRAALEPFDDRLADWQHTPAAARALAATTKAAAARKPGPTF